MIKQMARTAFARTLDSSASGALAARVLETPATHLLYLHDGPNERWFRLLLDRLSQHFDLIDFAEASRRISTGQHPNPAVSFSFDDGFASNEMHARALADSGVSAAFFVCSDLIGRDEAGVTEFFGGKQPEGVLTWEQIEQMAELGHLIGSHTATHANLASLSIDQVVTEVEQSRSSVISKLGSCDHFAWPYGRAQHISKAALEWLVRSDLTSISSAVRGSHRGDQPTRLLLRHVIQPLQSFESVLGFLALSLFGVDNHRAERTMLAQASNDFAATEAI